MPIYQGVQGVQLEYKIKLDLKRLALVRSFVIENNKYKWPLKSRVKVLNEKKQAYVKKHFME
jgi:hypothetical protein